MLVKKVTQLRFYENDSKENYPLQLTSNKLIDGSAFASYMPTIQLGIQALPGTKFYLNGHDNSPIIIGQTGIYELNLNGEIEINALRFDSNSINEISKNPYSYLIVDIIYEGE